MRLYAIDVETGGFSAREHALLSIGAVEVGRPERALQLWVMPADGLWVR